MPGAARTPQRFPFALQETLAYPSTPRVSFARIGTTVGAARSLLPDLDIGKLLFQNQLDSYTSCSIAFMSTYSMKVAYNGAPFCGFAKQPGQLTVQGELENALQLPVPSRGSHRVRRPHRFGRSRARAGCRLPGGRRRAARAHRTHASAVIVQRAHARRRLGS